MDFEQAQVLCYQDMRTRLLVSLLLFHWLILGCTETDRSAGVIEGPRRSESNVTAIEAARKDAQGTLDARSSRPLGETKSILFGDLHVHTTFSIDAFLYALPLFAGEGAHPPADACDFARYCSQLDFFSINDHAESLTPARWQETKQSIRQCNELAGDSANPDLVSFIGWEWTQGGATPAEHYGHKNVIFPGLTDSDLPARPIDSLPPDTMKRARAMWLVHALTYLGPVGLGDYADFLWQIEQLVNPPPCEPDIDTRELPDDCRESATTPAALFRKLRQWGFDTLVIPHGLAWGIHAPPGTRIGNQLNLADHDAQVQRLIEIYSGHGNGEEFRDFAEYRISDEGERICPEPTPDYLPCCWQAGEIMRKRCGDLPKAICQARVEEARQLALDAGQGPHRVFPDTEQEDWLDCDQCRDCFKPVMALRPGETAQYATAISSFDERDEAGRPLRFRFGFIASTDNHAARPGTGYKQYARPIMSDARGISSRFTKRLLRPYVRGRQQDPARAQPMPEGKPGFRGLLDVERVSSFLYPGGIVGVHASGRDRMSIWRALETREVYGTSGPRILLWFDMLNAPTGSAPMGSEVVLSENPRFEVRAAGAFVQEPGCPTESLQGLSKERLERLCRGECYNPGEQRCHITQIEVVRIRPRQGPDELVADMIEDPWRRFDCPPDPSGCVVSFEDADYRMSGRDAVYYVRALQEPTPAINGANQRTEFDEKGRAIRTNPCFGDYRTPFEDDCLAPVQERAWSSPIYVDQPGPDHG